VISSVPQEGKTTTSLSLAHLCARAGLATILIDLDTRRSVIQKELSPYVKVDLSDYMIGTAELDETIIRPRGVDFDLAVTSRHPALLADSVSSGRMGELIDRLKTRYHVVIIDAPPILAVSDGLALSTVVDKVLYLVRWRKTSRRSVASGLAALKNVGVTPAGLVLTIADTNQDDASEHYGYGYGYGADRSKAK
jgi:capsular exopolysaccharide synthesis family protein